MLGTAERQFWDSLLHIIAGCVVIGCYACLWATAPAANVDGAQWFTDPVLVADSQGRVDLRLSESTGNQAHWSLRDVPEEIRLLGSRLEPEGIRVFELLVTQTGKFRFGADLVGVDPKPVEASAVTIIGG